MSAHDFLRVPAPAHRHGQAVQAGARHEVLTRQEGRPVRPSGGIGVNRVATVLCTALGAAWMVNGYRPLSGRSIPSVLAWLFGLLATELPLQTVAGQAGTLAVASRGLSARQRKFAWLLTAASCVGLLGLHRIGRNANR